MAAAGGGEDQPEVHLGWTPGATRDGSLVGMTIFDYLLNIVLVALVVLQMRGRRLDRRGLVLPLVLVAWAASHYLHGIPTVGKRRPAGHGRSPGRPEPGVGVGCC